MTVLRSKVSVEGSSLHNPSVGKCFPFVLSIGTIFRRRTQSSEAFFPSGRSSPGRVTRLANIGASVNLGHLREYKAESGLLRTIYWSSCGGGNLTEH